MTTLPPVTTKQQEILKLLYRYRFLNRTHIQILLGHKDKRRIISWLKDLREKQYVDWRYNASDFVAKTKPAVYYLALNGIRYLRELGGYPSEQLRKRYRESARTQEFIDQCLLIADCCIMLQSKNGYTLRYVWLLPIDYASTNTPSLLADLQPNLYFSKREGHMRTNYVLENFRKTLTPHLVRKRLKECLAYLADWDDTHEPRPTLLCICSDTAELLYIKRQLKRILAENWSNESLHIRAAILEKVRTLGVTSQIWEAIC